MTNVTRFGLDDILGNEVVDFAVLESNYEILGNNAAHTAQDNTFQGGNLFNVRQMVRAVLAGGTGTEVLGNAYYDGSAYQRYNVANLAVRVRCDSGGAYIETSAPAANPITNWVVRFQVGANGVVSSVVGTLPRGGSAGQALVKNSATDYDAIWVPTSNVGAQVFEAQNISGSTVTLLQPPMINGIMGVYVNGQALIQTRDWSIAGSVITFTQALSGDDVHIEYLQTTSMGTDAASVDGLSAYPWDNPQPLQLVGTAPDGRLPGSVVPDVSNLLQNGGFDNWNRGPGPFDGTGHPFCADGWLVFKTAPATVSVSRDTANADISGVCAAISFNNSGGGGGVLSNVLGQVTPVQAWKWAPALSNFYGKTLTFTARVRTNVAGAANVRIWDGVNLTTGTAHSGSNQYETLRVTATIPANCTTVEVGVFFTTTCTVYVDNAMCVFGSQPAPFLPNLAVPDMIPNERLSRDVARANMLTNGGFEVWQRGNGPMTTGYHADRWGMNKAGSDTISVSRDAANQDNYSQVCAAVSYTRVSGGSNIGQTLTERNSELANQTVSFSVRVKTTAANAVRLRIWDGSPTFSAYHSGSGFYETLTVTRRLVSNPSLLSFDVDFQQTCTAYVDNAMLVSGSIPADYLPMHPADELVRCQRYFQRYLAGEFAAAGVAYSAPTNAMVPVMLPAKLGVIPTVTFVNVADWQLTTGGGSISCTSITPYQLSTALASFVTTVAGGLVAREAVMLFCGVAGRYVDFEANP